MANPNSFTDEFAKLIWGKRSEGLPVPELDLKREITPQEMFNVYKNAAFVQIICPEPIEQPSTISAQEYKEGIRLTYSRSNWPIVDYQTAMSASPGDTLYQHGKYVQNADGNLERVCSGIGTIQLQIVNTAEDMVRIAKEELHWPSIHIVDGYSLMSWAVWKAAKDLNIPVSGYVPSKEDEAKYSRILANCPTLITKVTEAKTAQP